MLLFHLAAIKSTVANINVNIIRHADMGCTTFLSQSVEATTGTVVDLKFVS